MWQGAGSADVGRITFAPNRETRHTWPEIDPSIFNIPPRPAVTVLPARMVTRWDSDGREYFDVETIGAPPHPGGEVRNFQNVLPAMHADDLMSTLSSLICRIDSIRAELVALKAKL